MLITCVASKLPIVRLLTSQGLGSPMRLRSRKTGSVGALGRHQAGEKGTSSSDEDMQRRTAAPAATGAAAADQLLQQLAVPTPAAPRKRARLPPVDIGIPALLLGGGVAAAGVADAVDHLPLREAAFTPTSLALACECLKKADPKLAPLIEQLGPPERLLAKRGSNFATLAKAIAFQQLSTLAAAKIYGRVLAACGCQDTLTPAAVLAAPPADLRAAGLSERKVSYVQDLAARFADGRLSDAKIEGWDEATLEAELTQVRGIGVWSVHMHAIFHMGSPDVLPVGDLGVRRGMMHLYGLKDLPGPEAMHRIASKWRPFASLGSYYMWKVETPQAQKTKKVKKG